MGDQDHSYKLLFAHPQLVRDLLEGFVGGEWVRQIDFTSLKRVSDNYVSDNLRARADDIVWRVRCGEIYVYLLLEFQSRVDPYMALRVLTYEGLLYQDLLKSGQIASEGGRLPSVLPIVLYNGLTRWAAPDNLAALMAEAPVGLEPYRPQSRYRLIDETRYTDADLARSGNLAAALFRIENCRSHEQIPAIVRPLLKRLRQAGLESLRRAFVMWLGKVILARLPHVSQLEADRLWEEQAMLSERFDQWEAEFMQAGRQAGRQEGEAMLLARLLQKRFGELPRWIHECLHRAPPAQLEEWGDKLFEAGSLSALFGEAPADAVASASQAWSPTPGVRSATTPCPAKRV